jgi:hypothetical protein
MCAVLYLLFAHVSAFATPSDIGHLIRSKNLEEKVLIPHQIETSRAELTTQPKEVNLRAILEPHASSKEEVRAVLNILNNPSILTVSVRLLDSEFFDDKVARDYRDRLKDFAFTGCQRDGFKFFQQMGHAPIREDLWRELSEEGREDVERIFTEARSGGEVVLLDRAGKLYRLTNSFSITRLSENQGIDGVALLGRGVYTDLATIGQTIATAVSEPNRSLFDLSEAIPSIYAFSLKRMGEESPGSTIQYYVSVGITSQNVEGGEPLYDEAAIIPILVKVEQRSEEVCDNGADDDGDGSVDCGDSDCSSSAACPTPPPQEDCYNATDDDSDGAADCSDSDCASLPSCAPPSEDCTNGIDDDGDGYTDCSDSDCQSSFTCSAECPYGGGSCNCWNSWWGWGSRSCDCSSCPQQPQNPEFLTLSESNSYPLGCYSDEFSFQARFPVYGDYAVHVDGQNVRYLGWTSGDQAISLSLTPGYHQLTLVNQSGAGSASVNISTYYSCERENCFDGYDNDRDGLADCRDPECSGYWACFSMPENCSDGIDNNNNGATDCSDSDCSTDPSCIPQREDCANGRDDDGDDFIDGDDSSCRGSEVIPAEGTPLATFDPLFGIRLGDQSPRIVRITDSTWRLETATEGAAPVERAPVRVQIRDGVIEALFAQEERGVFQEYLAPNTRYRLTLSLRGVDENEKEFTVADHYSQLFTTPDTAVLPDGVVLVRHDIVLEAKEVSTPVPTETPATIESECGDGADNDGDGASDCADSDCSGSPSCAPPSEDCTNGIDDDGDGYTDCSDSDCQSSFTCIACSAECPYGGGSCNCWNSWWGWGSCSCDCSSCPQQPQNPEFLTLSESNSYPLGCYSDEWRSSYLALAYPWLPPTHTRQPIGCGIRLGEYLNLLC